MAQYQDWIESAKKHGANPHYNSKGFVCQKRTSYTPRCNDAHCSKYTDKCELLPIDIEEQYALCVLPPGHKGNCNRIPNIFKKNDTTDKLIASINHSIYTTPGNDDIVYKNRASRLFPVVLCGTEEKKIRDKKINKKCAIPLKEASTPENNRNACIDWYTFIVNIKGIDEHLDTTKPLFKEIMNMLDKNKKHLIKVYSPRKIFDEDGYTMCVITQKTCDIKDFSDISRDNRTIILDTDIQLGHNEPRSDSYISIRGENLLPMTRIGNIIIGDKKFTEDIWLEGLYGIVSAHKYKSSDKFDE
jgi:hypothetical protein